MPGSKLLARIHEISEKSNLENVAVSFYDYETSLRFSFQGDRTFHAASTFKAAILFALFKAVEEGRARLEDPLHVRNRFRSIIDGSPYRIDRERDGDSAVHKMTGRSMSLQRLAHVMITRSSNLATNLLMEFMGVDFIRARLNEAGVHGMQVRRGVEDHVAFQNGVSNETTADALLRLFRVFLEEKHLLSTHREKALDILLAQEFKSMIPAKMPPDVKVAHKTGEISTHCHDAGIVFIPERQPYVVSILTESAPANTRRQKAVAEIASMVHRYLISVPREDRLEPEGTTA